MYKIICLIGKSGSGKSTIEQKLCSDLEINHLISHTTRPPRKEELEGLDYFFFTVDYFEEQRENFIEQRLYKIINKGGDNMSRFLTGRALAQETFKQLVYTVQKSSKKRNARRRKRMK